MTSARGGLIERIAGWTVDHPWRTLLVGVLLVAAVFPGLKKLKPNTHQRIWVEPGHEILNNLDEFETKFGSDVASIVVIHSPSGIFDKDSAKLVVDVTERMWKVAETMRVESLSNFQWVHADGEELIVEDLIPDDRDLTDDLLAQRKKAALEHEQLPGFLISPDGKTTLVFGWLEPERGGEVRMNNYFANAAGVRDVIKEFQGKGDHQLYLTGFPALEEYIAMAPAVDSQKLNPIILVMLLVLLFFFFRRPSGMLMPLLVVLPTVMATLGVAGHLGYGINPMTIMAPQILFTIGISCCTHPLFLYYRGLNSGIDRRTAARHALSHTLRPDLFSCLTVGIGFASLMFIDMPPTQHLGIIVAIGTMILWLLVVCLLGPLMVLLPIKAKTKKGKASDMAELEEPSPRARALTDWIDRNKIAIIGGWLALTALSLFLVWRNYVSYNPVQFYPESADIRKSTDFTVDAMGWSESWEIIIDSGEEEGIKDPAFLKKVDAFGSWIAKQDKVVRVTSLVDILKEVNRALQGGDPKQYLVPEDRAAIADLYTLYMMNLPLGKNLNERVSTNNDALRMTVLSKLEWSHIVVAEIETIKAKAKEMGLDIIITGRSLFYHQTTPLLVNSLSSNLLGSVIPIALLLMFMFRSWRLGILSLIPNIIPLAVGAGCIFWIVDRHFDVATVAFFSLAIGMAVDDTVHFLDGYHNLRKKGLDAKEAITRMWMTVGPAMIIATIVLSSCFLVFVLASFVPLRSLGILTASMLVIAMLCDLTLTPAILLLIGKKKDGAKTGGGKKADDK